MADTSNSNANNIGSELSNLYEFIDKDGVHGLNLAVPEDAKAIIKPWDERDNTDRYAESGVDDQLILHVPFTQHVRLKSILLKLGRGEFTPRQLRIYANHPTIVDFADAENTRPHLNVSLLEGETGVVEYPFRVAAFASVTSLSLFFSDATGGDMSRIYFLVGDTGSKRSRCVAGG
uniref:PITH domain-containing protein n=1 Tax=Mycena chlorophos TaxID=658473 RepID=A0ABQ0LPC0_MYCCL|nr:predicted protein [Mycena chlorophos]